MTTTNTLATVEAVDASQTTAAKSTTARATISRKQLTAKLQTIRKVAPNKSPKPVLTGVVVAIADGVLALRSYDLENALALGIPADCEGEGEAILSAKLLTETVRDAVGETVTLSITSGVLTVASDSASTTLPTLADRNGNALTPADLPGVPSVDWQACVDIDARQLCEALTLTGAATDTESSRFTLGAVKIEATADGIDVIGTDGRRLHRASGHHEFIEFAEAWQADDVLLPIAAIKALLSALKSSADVVTVALGKNQLQFSTPGVCLVARLAEGRFPRWRDVFPRFSEIVKVELAAADLTKACKAAKAWTHEERRGVDFTITADGLSLSSRGIGDPSRATVTSAANLDAAPLVDGEQVKSVTSTLDVRFLIDFASKLPRQSRLSIEISDSSSAVVLRSGNFSAVVMPLAC